jgi:Fe-S cluster assembly protein SufD
MMGAQSPKAEALSQRLAALTLPVGLPAAREAALSRLSAMGLPTRRDEYWRYTDPVSLTSPLRLAFMTPATKPRFSTRWTG